MRANYALNPRGISGGFFAGYGAQSYTAATGVPVNPDGLTTAVRVSYSAGAGNPGIIVMPLPDVSSTYTFSAWVYNEGPTEETIALALKGASSGGSTLVPPGVWTKLSWTYTTPASLGAGNDFGVRIASPTSTGSFLSTSVLIEKLPTLNAYFDGSTAASGDFTHTWAGASHNSASYQWGTTLRTIGTSGSGQAIQSSDWSATGTKSLRLLTKVSNGQPEAGLPTSNLEFGKTYTILAKLRINKVSSSSATRSRRINFYHSQNNQASFTEAPGAASPNAIGVYDHRHVIAIPPNTTHIYLRLGGHSSNAFEADAWWDDIMIVEGVYTGEYVDGDKPFSRWEGTAHNSTSVGYPPQLLDLAGPPALEQIGIGNSANPVVNGFAARTLYVVYETAAANDTSWQTPFYYGSNAPTDGFTLQTAAAGNYTMSPRLDFASGAGSINRGFSFPNGRMPVRRHVLAVSFNEGMTYFNAHGNGVSLTSNAVIDPGSIGWPSGQLRNILRADIKAVYSSVYYAEHDAATRIAISRYLGNKYGAPVA